MFPVVIRKKKNEKEYSVYFPDLDVATSGVDMEDAINSARELLNITINGMKQEKLEIPKTTTFDKMKVAKNKSVFLVKTTGKS